MDATGTPPYARIANELRDRIERGVLAPGDRVPSTREIIRNWGVAMATATKALASLTRDGLVRSVPGVGTVVAEAPGPTARPVPSAPGRAGVTAVRRRPAPELSPDRIVAAATVVADAEGLAGLSMRRVATEIGVATMSLYRHVADKDDLVLRMIDAAFGEVLLPPRAGGWRERLEIAARSLWAAFRRHPWLASAMSVTRPQPSARGLVLTEWVLSALDGHGLAHEEMLTAHITLVNFVRGTAVNIETEAEAEAVTGLSSEEWLQTQESTVRSIIATGRFPTFERIVSAGYDFDLDTLFDFGLQRLLDGLSLLIDGPDRRS